MHFIFLAFYNKIKSLLGQKWHYFSCLGIFLFKTIYIYQFQLKVAKYLFLSELLWIFSVYLSLIKHIFLEQIDLFKCYMFYILFFVVFIFFVFPPHWLWLSHLQMQSYKYICSKIHLINLCLQIYLLFPLTNFETGLEFLLLILFWKSTVMHFPDAVLNPYHITFNGMSWFKSIDPNKIFHCIILELYLFYHVS